MCGGGGSNEATRSAERQERQRQARISANVAQIESAFKGREPQFADFLQALREQFGEDLSRQRAQATRQSKFSLARSGLTGGSAAIDLGRLLQREGEEGALAAERQARGAEADLRAADEATRLQMISLAQSGADIGNAATQTANSLRANIEGARSRSLAEGIGDVFGRTAQTVRAQQEAEKLRRGVFETRERLFGPSSGGS